MIAAHEIGVLSSRRTQSQVGHSWLHDMKPVTIDIAQITIPGLALKLLRTFNLLVKHPNMNTLLLLNETSPSPKQLLTGAFHTHTTGYRLQATGYRPQPSN